MKPATDSGAGTAVVDNGWKFHFAFFRVRTISGERTWGNVMRRVVNGVPEYREMTPTEAFDHESEVAW
jgi:hypothetical protein